MIDLYTAATPNGYKASIMLEEVGLPYKVHPISFARNEQLEPWFLQINPNNKIPAIVDSDGPDGAPISIFESGAILMYLAQKTHSALLPREPRAFSLVMQWLFFQMAGVGPMFGQMNHFVRTAKEKIPYAIERYTNESKRILGVMDGQLRDHAFLAGKDYSIADVATYPWVNSASRILSGLESWAHVQAWRDRVGARPAVQRGLRIPEPPSA